MANQLLLNNRRTAAINFSLRLAFAIGLLTSFALGLAEYASATIYMFTDKNGIMHFTNVPANSRYKPIPSTLPAVNRVNFGSHNQYAEYIGEAARRYNLDPNLIKAIIKAESNFNTYALSRKGAKGLMQLMPGTARDMNVTNVYDPRDNIFGGTRYFKELYNFFDGDLKLALASYNAGINKVRHSRTIPDITETKQYVKRVLKNYQYYQDQSY